MLVVGIDLGYGFSKAKSQSKIVQFPSLVGEAVASHYQVVSNGVGTMFISPEAKAVGGLAVSRSTIQERREDRSWFLSETYHFLLMASLSELFPEVSVGNVQLVTGLPVSYISTDRDRLKRSLLRTFKFHIAGRPSQAFAVQDVIVLPQGYAAFISEVLDPRTGAIVTSDLANAHVGVVDVGCGTVGFLGIREMKDVPSETASFPGGTWRIVSQVRRYLEDKLPGLALGDHEIMGLIAEGRAVSYYGKTVSLKLVINEALDDLAGNIVSRITSLWGSGAQMDRVYLAGGGADLIGPKVESILAESNERLARNIELLNQPQTANVRGYFAYGLRKWRDS